MTDSTRTPQPSSALNGHTAISQFLASARYISNAERAEGFNTGGVTLNYSADGASITGTFTIPVERTVNSDGSESLRPASFLA